MICPICPVCGQPLASSGNSLCCKNRHGFDIARQGYVNLLTVSQKHSLHPGDSREMVAARRAFLSAGYYAPIAQRLRALLARYAPQAQSILDVGCGEGYYLSHVDAPERWGIDISKEAVRYAAARDKGAHWLTATATHLPFADGSFDCLLSMFALTAQEEFSRVLKPSGLYLRVVAGEGHLLALKRIIYPTLTHKDAPFSPALAGFDLLHREDLSFRFTLDTPEMVQNLLYMTPHAWRISQQGAQALRQTQILTDQAEVIFCLYGRQGAQHLVK